jgi:hypothetical protein
MPNIVTINMKQSSVEKIFKGHQMCLLSDTQQCFVGDVFPLHLNGETRYFRVIDIWQTPKDFAIKFLWRLCGTKSNEELINQFKEFENNGINVDMIFSHMYAQISAFDEIKNLVKS